MPLSAHIPDRTAVAARQQQRLGELLAAVLPTNRFYGRKLRGLASGGLHPPLAELPFTTKAELLADQEAHPPYGSNLTFPLAAYGRMHQSSGTTTGRPLRWLDTPASWQNLLGCWHQIFRLVGLRDDDHLFFAFSFGPFLGFWTAFDAAAQLGRLCLPGGGLSSTARLRCLREHAVTVVLGTPTYALHLAEVATAEGIDLAASPVRMLILAGEPGGSIPATRARIEAAWGARVFDHSGMTEVGPVAVECAAAPGGLHVLEGDYIAEVVDPDTGGPRPAGEVGELVLTGLVRPGSPLIRYRTGDLAAIDPEPCRCGCPFVRLRGGILGRTDDMIHVRGNNVYPSALEAVIRRFAEVMEYRVEVDQTGPLAVLKVAVEAAGPASGAEVAAKVDQAIRDELLFRAEVTAVPPGTLPRFEMKARRLHHRGTENTERTNGT